MVFETFKETDCDVKSDMYKVVEETKCWSTDVFIVLFGSVSF